MKGAVPLELRVLCAGRVLAGQTMLSLNETKVEINVGLERDADWANYPAPPAMKLAVCRSDRGRNTAILPKRKNVRRNSLTPLYRTKHDARRP
jgi:hypothetical protein